MTAPVNAASLDCIDGRPMADKRFILATDLDGTFLGGSSGARAMLYDWIEAHRDDIGLIFVTGRDPRFIAELCAGDVPWPDFAIGDVGATIAQVHPGDAAPVRPIEALEADIVARWGDAGPRVRAALDGAAGLRLQTTPFRHRVSYDYDPAHYHPAAARIVADLGLDHLISDNRFFDVLPKGVAKGPSLLRLIAHLGARPDRVLAAGDTMNDLSMLHCGLHAVAVGGSEAPLLDALPRIPRIHRARAIGAAGILEAVRAFDLHPSPKGDLDVI
jgi:hydroxymethylpyrimidine pyrophosphatase-like HAD family hydrolase